MFISRVSRLTCRVSPSLWTCVKGRRFPFEFVSSMSSSTTEKEKQHVLLPPRFVCPFILTARSKDEVSVVNKYLSLINHCDYRKPFVGLKGSINR